MNPMRLGSTSGRCRHPNGVLCARHPEAWRLGRRGQAGYTSCLIRGRNKFYERVREMLGTTITERVAEAVAEERVSRQRLTPSFENY